MISVQLTYSIIIFTVLESRQAYDMKTETLLKERGGSKAGWLTVVIPEYTRAHCKVRGGRLFDLLFVF